MFGGLIGSLGLDQIKQSLPGIKSDPLGSLTHFIGSTTANILDPADIFGKSGSNPIKNFLNPGGVTLIPSMTPSNQPLPGAPGSATGASSGTGSANGTPAFGPMGSGIPASQLSGLTSAYNNYLKSIGQPQMNNAFLSGSPLQGQGGQPLPTPIGTPQSLQSGGMTPQMLAQLAMLNQQNLGQVRAPQVGSLMPVGTSIQAR